jgi:MoaA/NifB/PqqE/SkfB family radical SAM enzyme
MRLNRLWTYRRILLTRGFAAAVTAARRNIRGYKLGRSLPCGPYMAEFDITYRCNSRCLMCQRWRDSGGGELTLAEYRDLAGTLRDMGTHQISIAGGEPLLRRDVFPIIRAFSERGASVNLCTNGILLERYAEAIAASGATCVTVSLDGALEGTHDRIRGTPGACARIEAGIRTLLQRPASRRPLLRVRMTFSRDNAHEISDFFGKWDGVADDVLLQPIHRGEEALYTSEDPALFRLDPETLAKQIAGTPLAKDPSMRRLLHSLRHTGGFPRQECYAGVLMARIDPWGRVYPCLAQHRSIGSVREQAFPALWNGVAARGERDRLRRDRPCNCWFNNTALIGYYGARLHRPARSLLGLLSPGKAD